MHDFAIKQKIQTSVHMMWFQLSDNLHLFHVSKLRLETSGDGILEPCKFTLTFWNQTQKKISNMINIFF